MRVAVITGPTGQLDRRVASRLAAAGVAEPAPDVPHGRTGGSGWLSKETVIRLPPDRTAPAVFVIQAYNSL